VSIRESIQKRVLLALLYPAKEVVSKE